MKINLKYYKHSAQRNNFGDELSPYIVSKVLSPAHSLVYNDSKKGNANLIAIGSLIHTAETGDHIWGAGVRTDPPSDLGEQANHNYQQLAIHAVRGPLSKRFLQNKGQVVPDVFGDPALLLPRFFQPSLIPSLKTKIAIVPHYTTYHQFKKNFSNRPQQAESLYHLIDPCQPCLDVVNQIVSCRAVISSGLHGLVVADAYNIPNLWLNEHIGEGDFKFLDYFASQSRPTVFIERLEDFNETLLYAQGNKVDLDKLLESFPFQA